MPVTGTPVTLRSAVVVGTGLIGTSVALALRECGVRVWLSDRDPSAARLAAELGAGEVLPESEPAPAGPRAAGLRAAGLRAAGPRTGGLSTDAQRTSGQAADEPRTSGPAAAEPGTGRPRADLAVIAVPPAAVASSLAGAQAARLARWYTDVASVKSMPLAAARDLGCELGSFVGSHPLSGRERSGPAPARADLFLGRPWVICPGEEAAPEAVAAVTALVRCCRAEPVLLSPAQHDAYVALVSHAPHVVAAAMAARLAEAPAGALALSGPGVADVTRIAGGDSGLWAQILAANAAPVADVVDAVAADLVAVAEALRDAATAGPRDAARGDLRDAARTGPRDAAPADLRDAARTGPRDAAPADLRDAARAGPRGAAPADLCDAARAGPRGAAPGDLRDAARAGPRGAARAGPRGAAPADLRDAARTGPPTAARAGLSPHGREAGAPPTVTDSGRSTGDNAHDPALKVLLGLLDAGVAGVARVPGKRGRPRREDVVVQVVIGDRPGELARLFQAAGDAGVNIEDIGIEHSPGLPVGVAELTVAPAAAARLAEALAAAGWPVRR